jgi:hypothetical protein
VSSHFSFAVHQEPDDVGSYSMVRVVLVSLVIGCAGVAGAGALLVAAAGSLEPEDAESKAVREPARWPIERTPIWKTRRGIDLREEQRGTLRQGARWVDGGAGVVTMPIDEAVDIVIGQSP